jgi:predicted dehydrogenase
MRAICGRDEEAVRSAADALGWEGYETEYARMLERDDIRLVDISSSGGTPHEFAVAALEAGKHVLCEKPLANTLVEAREMVEAARRVGTLSMVCHNYRRAPAVQLAKRLIDEGRLGEIRHWRAVYLQDWLLDPATPMTWRLRKETGGAGPRAAQAEVCRTSRRGRLARKVPGRLRARDATLDREPPRRTTHRAGRVG